MTPPAGTMLWGVNKQGKDCDIMILMIPLSLIVGAKNEGNFVKAGVEWWERHLLLRIMTLKTRAFSDIKARSLLGYIKNQNCIARVPLVYVRIMSMI